MRACDDQTPLWDGPDNIRSVIIILYVNSSASVFQMRYWKDPEQRCGSTSRALQLNDRSALNSVLPRTFLSGSAGLYSIQASSYMGSLLSANNLVLLDIWNSLDSRCLPPGIMVSCLTVLARNISYWILPSWGWPRANNPTSSTWFRSVNEYSEDPVAQFHLPFLAFFEMTTLIRSLFWTSPLRGCSPWDPSRGVLCRSWL